MRRDGTASVRILNHVCVQRVRRTPLLGIPWRFWLVGLGCGREESYILHDHIVGGDAVGCDEEEGFVVDFV